MSAIKRTRIASPVSECNPKVTLLELADVNDSPRRSKRVRTAKFKEEITLTDLEDLGVAPLTPKKTPRSKNPVASSSKAIPQVLNTPHPAPPNWRVTYDHITNMRARFVAPVDTMGCQMAQVGELDPIVSAEKSQYTHMVFTSYTEPPIRYSCGSYAIFTNEDEIMNAAVINLRKAFGGSITIMAMIEAEDSVISKAIAQVGFWRKKTVYLKKTAICLRDEFGSDVPNTVDELCSLPGVGPKMAFLTLQMAWNLNNGIGVDVHVHRITNLLGWHTPPTKTPEQTRLNLQSWLPKELYRDINHMLVGFGQVVCLPVGPRCDVCDLSTKSLCPSAQKVTSKKRRAIIFTKGQESPPEVEITVEEDAKEQKFAPDS